MMYKFHVMPLIESILGLQFLSFFYELDFKDENTSSTS